MFYNVFFVPTCPKVSVETTRHRKTFLNIRKIKQQVNQFSPFPKYSGYLTFAAVENDRLIWRFPKGTSHILQSDERKKTFIHYYNKKTKILHILWVQINSYP